MGEALFLPLPNPKYERPPMAATIPSVIRETLAVPGSDASIPMITLKGGAGPRFALTAGVHADEYVGEQALVELARELADVELAGSVTIVPVANTVSFERRGTSMVPNEEDRGETNLNRVFPGDAEGNLAQRVAYAVFHGAIEGADFYVDLHSGDYYEDLAPHLYYVADLPVGDASRALAACTDVAAVVPCYETVSGGTYAAAAAAGTPSILLERGGMGAWSREEVDAVKRDILNMLRHAGIVAGEALDLCAAQYDYEDMRALYAPVAGCWYPTKRSGSAFAAGEVLGEIRDLFGEVLHEVVAPGAGCVIYQTGSLNVVKDGPLIAYGLYA